MHEWSIEGRERRVVLRIAAFSGAKLRGPLRTSSAVGRGVGPVRETSGCRTAKLRFTPTTRY